ncbi:IS630 family transposase [Deinococcus cellulosilyticus]|uniref:Putative transposase n=2 Tax=Deinococcus cellulosilyticus TaxID=401558 RepID=A0A511NBK5_DEIC1|nr:IS630 family transposase [Deinococcus cellulosilyticus]GEM50209.1 putative transposase [Deinococcus cellulosilyticus NBRC 106333 = KACC 11606]
MVVDEVGSSLKTLKGYTWAHCGKTPVMPTHGHWENLSIIGGMTPCGKVYQQSYPHAIRAVQVVKFFRHLLRHLEGPLVVLLDNARIHRAKMVQEFLKSESGKRITVFHTPPYAPEFNPIEWLWSWMKRTRIQNLCPKNLSELKKAWLLGFRHVRSKPDLVPSFFRASSLGEIS